MQHRYLCERCGGTGHQEAGCWSGKAYNSKKGTCEFCGGTGYLGSKVYSHADTDEFSGYIFHGCQRIPMAEVAKRLNAMQGVIDRLDNEIASEMEIFYECRFDKKAEQAHVESVIEMLKGIKGVC